MKTEDDALATERQFFSSLTASDVPALDRILSDDFLLVDVMAGNVIPKPDFLQVIESKMLTFASIDPVESLVRHFANVTVIVGRTEMKGTFAGAPFEAASRYTHVFAQLQGRWQLVSAQGTQIQ